MTEIVISERLRWINDDQAERVTVLECDEKVQPCPAAWMNTRGNTISNDKYEEMKNSDVWGWIIDECWTDATPLYAREQDGT